MNIVVSDPETRKAYSKKMEKPAYVGKKIKDKINLGEIGLEGYEGIITGGSDKDGIPMNSKLDSSGRKKKLITPGVGFKSKVKGIRIKRTVRGNTVSTEIHQLNIKITKKGSKKLDEIFPPKEKPKEEAK